MNGYRNWITGDGGITKIGSGTKVTLSRWDTGSIYLSMNNFVGPITIEAGTLSVARNSVPVGTTINVESGAYLQLAGSYALGESGNPALPAMINISGGTLYGDNNSTSHVLGNITLESGAIKTGAFTLDGTITVKENISGNSSISDGSITIRNGGTFDIETGGLLAISSRILGSSDILKTGGGQLTLSGSSGSNSTFSGDIVVSSGTLSISRYSVGSSNSITMEAGTTLILSGEYALIGSAAANVPGEIILNNATIRSSTNNVVQPLPQLTLNDSTLTISTGCRYVMYGDIYAGGTSKIGVNGTNDRLEVMAGSDGMTIDVATGGNLEIAAKLINSRVSGSNSNTITKTGDGLLTLTGSLAGLDSGSTALSGDIIIDGGTLSIKNNVITSVQNIYANAGTTLLLAEANTLANQKITLNGGTLNGSGFAQAAGEIVMQNGMITNGTYTVDTLTVTDGAVNASALTVSSELNLTGNKSTWNLDNFTSGGKINLRLDASGGLSTLNVDGTATINSEIDLRGVSGAAFVKTETIHFINAGTVDGPPTYSAETDAYFDANNDGSALSFTFKNDIPTLDFGGIDSVTFADAPQESGWLRLEKDPDGEFSTLLLTLVSDTSQVIMDDLLLYLNSGMNEFGYYASASGEDDAARTYYISIDAPAELFEHDDTVYFGWDFASFNAANSTNIKLFDAASVPEPTTWAMMLAGLLGLLCFRRRRR